MAERQRLVRDTFGAELAGAKTPEQKLALGREFRRVAGTSDQPLDRYVLLDGARRYFGECGDLEAAAEAVMRIAQEYDIDPNRLLQSTASENLARWDAPTCITAAEYLATRSEQAMAEGDAAAAKLLLAGAITAARRGRARELVAELSRNQAELEQRVRQMKKVDDALRSLAADPADAAAHLVVGVHRCFVEERWADGLGHLAASGDETIVPIARRELAMATLAETIAVAEAWMAWAEGQKGRDRESWKLAAERHARGLLAGRLEKLAGPDRARVEKLLGQAAFSGGAGRADPRSIPGLVVWFDASEAASMRGAGLEQATIGGPVATWRDKAGGPLKAVAVRAAGGQPTLGLLPGANLPAVTFDGVKDAMVVADWPAKSLAGVTVFVVMAVPASAPGQPGGIQTIFDNRHDQTGGVELQIRGDQRGGPLEYASWPLGSAGAALHQWVRAKPQLLVVAGASTAEEDRMFVNGSHVATARTGRPIACRNDVVLGAWQPPYMNEPTRNFGGCIAEVFVYGRSLTPPELAALSESLMAKWSVR
jgi:hypothetical protein